MTQPADGKGEVYRIAGPVAEATGLGDVRLNDVVRLGADSLVGEVIRLDRDRATVQVYEETAGVKVGEPVRNVGRPLDVSLGPGLLSQVIDGLQRPLESIAEQGGIFIERGADPPPLDAERTWWFEARVEPGQVVGPGDILGVVRETDAIEHLVMLPPNVQGKIEALDSGEYQVEARIGLLRPSEPLGDDREAIKLVQRWPVRQARPIGERLDPIEPLVTGTRVIDAFFPVAKGGSAVIPGGFGTGKTVTEQALARWADVDIVVYVGCGERGNEMAEVLEDFPQLKDPLTGASIMDRTVLIANTSNMPVAAREASIYTGMTIAEYYRDMGYDVLMLADSTSRWGEALREISGLLEEMPAEEGFPAYLGARLSQFYERAGRVRALGGAAGAEQDARVGSVTVVGAVSPPGGDFSEPITQNSLRLAGTFWALDTDLSRRRHFPAISWLQSYSLYDFDRWYEQNMPADWMDLRRRAMALLEHEQELQEIVELVGPEALSPEEQLVLFTARSLREDFLQQSAFDEIDRFCPLEKTYWMLRAILSFHQGAEAALQAGISLDRIREMQAVASLAQMKSQPLEAVEGNFRALVNEIEAQFDALEASD